MQQIRTQVMLEDAHHFIMLLEDGNHFMMMPIVAIWKCANLFLATLQTKIQLTWMERHLEILLVTRIYRNFLTIEIYILFLIDVDLVKSRK